MSSYNNIRKIKYTKNPTDVVSLNEYIIFEDAHANEKYVVFKFSNNVNQRLFEIKFEVLQYNKDNELLEKSTVLHNNFVAEANDLFVPNAKLKVNFECESLEVKLEFAAFDRVQWSNGEFSDNSYRFEKYAESVSKSAQAKPSAEVKKEEKDDKQKLKRNKLGFSIRNIYRRNKAAFPAVFNVFLCLIVIGLVIFSTFYYKNVTSGMGVNGFVVKEESGFVTIISYTGNNENVVIPSTILVDEDYCEVTKIANGAFKNSDITSVEFRTEAELVIETGAFSGCSKLTSVYGGGSRGSITVMQGAFSNCKALTSFQVSTAELCSKCFSGTNNIKDLAFANVVYSGGKLLDIFSGLESITLNSLSMNASVTEAFMQGVTVLR